MSAGECRQQRRESLPNMRTLAVLRSVGWQVVSPLLGAVPLAGAAGPNLIRQGGFEGGLAAVTGAGWELDRAVTIEEGEAAAGSPAMQHHATERQRHAVPSHHLPR
jgi:hypothetical protein